MKTTAYFLILTAGLFVGGCGEKSSPATSTTNAATATGGASTRSSDNPLDAPGQYLGALTKAHQTATATADVTSLNRAIQTFSADKGRTPKDLQELVTEKYLPSIPKAPTGMKITYDAQTGSVKVVKE